MPDEQIQTQITVEEIPTEVYNVFKQKLKAKGNPNIRPVSATLQLISSTMKRNVPAEYSAQSLTRHSNDSDKSSREITNSISEKVASEWSVTTSNEISVSLEITANKGVKDVWGVTAKLGTSFKHSQTKTEKGSKEQVITNTEKLTIAPKDAFATLVVVRTKTFKNADMDTKYQVVDMEFAGQRMTFPKEDLMPAEDQEFTTTSKVTSTFCDAAYAQVKITGAMSDDQILRKAVEQLGW